MRFNCGGEECDAVEIVAEEIIDGNRWTEGVVWVDSWMNMKVDMIKNKLVMLEKPDNVVIAKCRALGASGLIFKIDVKIEVWIMKIVVNEDSWDKLLKGKDKWQRVWVDETNSRLLMLI